MHVTFFFVGGSQVIVLEDLLGLRFNLQTRTMYVKQYMYSANGDILETILMQKSKSEDGVIWILGCS